MDRNIICIQHNLAHSDCEDLDLIMALASFEYRIHLIFYGDGVLSLFNRDPASIYSKRLHALPLFDVNDIWVDEKSLSARKLSASSLPNTIKLLTRFELKNLLQHNLAVYTL